jgi:WD40-like Beta Propeller Repeat
MRHRLAILVTALALQGCFSSTVLISVRTDGTGTATLTAKINLRSQAEFERARGVPPENLKPEQELPEPDTTALNELFGVPVRMVSSKLETTRDEITRTTVVAFDDVNALNLPFPPIANGLIGGHGSSLAGVEGEPHIKFSMRPHENGDRLLMVTMPDERMDQGEPEIPPKTPDPTDAEVDAQVKRAMKGASIRLFVELDAPVLRTNAPARDGNRVTILDLDLARMAGSDGSKKIDLVARPASVQELLWTLNDLPGAVVPVERDVFLEFEAPQAAPPQPPSRPAAPDTEIYLAPMTIAGDRIEIGAVKNISRSPGYDNQPSFTRDGGSILFTSARGGSQTDIYRYDLSAERVSQLTNTTESEYSPTETPDGGISVVRVEGDGTQRLWRFTSDGKDPRVLLDAIKPVGYHAWADDHTVALYILGQTGTTQPSTLQIADTRSGAARQVASDVGRSLLRVPGGNTISFVQRERIGEKTTFTIKEVEPSSGSTRVLIGAVDGTGDVDCVWTPDGTLLMARNGHLYAWKRSDRSSWRDVASLDSLGLHGVTRLAVSPKGTLIAFVANPN